MKNPFAKILKKIEQEIIPTVRALMIPVLRLLKSSKICSTVRLRPSIVQFDSMGYG